MKTISRLFRRLPIIGNWMGGHKRPTRRVPARHSVPSVLVKSGPSLQADGLLRSFGNGEAKTYALQGVSLGLDAGNLNVLMGPSGSGKSTLLAVMSALLKPDGGKVTAFGQDLWRMNDSQLEKFRLKHCSYIFQGYNLFPAFTARQQLEVVLRWGGSSTAFEARKRSEQILGSLGLSHRMNLRPSQLSGGEKQRVAIGRALVKNPSFIFADEPTSALDWENGQQVIELLSGTAKRGTTVLVVTHDPRIVKFAHKVFELNDGRLATVQNQQKQQPSTITTQSGLIVPSSSGSGLDVSAHTIPVAHTVYAAHTTPISTPAYGQSQGHNPRPQASSQQRVAIKDFYGKYMNNQ
jgi:putative ABC transport system ATP-binding protein